MSKSNGILPTLTRKEAVATVQPPRYTALRSIAENLSRKNVDTAIVELYMEVMQRLTLLAYERSEGMLCNVDPITKRFLIGLPFGRNGHSKWGLSRNEGILMREMMQQRQAQTPDRPPGLWQYDRTRKNWLLNLFDYDTVEDAQRYWAKYPLTIGQYREARSRRGMSTG